MNYDQLAILYPLFVANQEGRILYVNEELKRKSSNLVIGKSVGEVFGEWSVSGDGCIATGKLDEESCLFLRKKWNVYEILFVGAFSQEVEDILEEVKELRRTNQKLDAIIESSFDGIYITDQKGVTIKTNSAIERITGIPKEYYLGKQVDQLVKRGILQFPVSTRVLKEKKSISIVQNNRAGKETLLTGSPIFNDEGEIDGVVTNIRDLSELMDLQAALQKANELNKKYEREIERLKGNEDYSMSQIVIRNEKMRQLYDIAERVLNVDATVLILGQTGVGKDVLAKFIYNESDRSDQGKFIKLNCGAIPPDLIESELFGYEGGAFTGANKNGKPGMFELADKGVLFLDEIAELPVNLQVKLLRVIQEREVQRVGSIQSKKIDVRLIAATNRDLREMVDLGTFREDLFYRLNVIPISIPPLSERREDILSLISFFLMKMNDKYNVSKSISEELKSFLYQYDWPGNIRELSNLIERLVLLTNDNIITMDHLPSEYQSSANESSPIIYTTLKEATEYAEKQVILRAIQAAETTYDLARVLDTSQSTIVRKLKKYNIPL
ncbi:sigma-54 interaction domain-containing protein [Bacillus massiliigorillae]|uniref:sigma-54 interaction domain-containing protein n=1 Tax=Bacillus massiliigorillae TaxID=1243664 RepID=UPI000399C921|nr:sigma 54-interacting transcriptional regulator [Bacillus massiliigorillae]